MTGVFVGDRVGLLVSGVEGGFVTGYLSSAKIIIYVTYSASLIIQLYFVPFMANIRISEELTV